MTFTRSCLLILCLTSVLRADLVKDRQLVRDKEIGTEPKAWLGFLESRILDERKESRLTSLIRQLASDLYTDREKAMAQLIQWGEVARPWLRKALKSSDLEVVRRSRVCLKKITVGESSRLTQAVIRLLAQKLTREVASTFIRYLPFSDDLSVQSEIHESLLKADVKDKELSTLLIASLQSKYPIVQGTAASILGRRREATIQKLVRPLLGHSDFKVRFQAGSALLQGEDATAMPAMLQLLEVAPLQIAWAVEDLLHQLASDKAPKTTLTGDPSDRKKTRRSWELWWESSASKVRLASLRESPAELGRTLGIEYNTSRVWECNRQGRMLWDIYVKSAMDARVLPGQRVLVVGAEGVSIRDFHGKVLKQIKTGVSPNG